MWDFGFGILGFGIFDVGILGFYDILILDFRILGLLFCFDFRTLGFWDIFEDFCILGYLGVWDCMTSGFSIFVFE